MPYSEEGKVLVVEDDEAMLSLMGRKFREANLDSILVGTAAQAIQAIGEAQLRGLYLDGLNGGWEWVANAAIAAGIIPHKVVLVTSSPGAYIDKAAEMGVSLVSRYKEDWLEQILRTIE
ncbi:MAG: hypothetical protein UU42_C0006G0003 [Candidatus Woesebacteria bacterium GW2011_GWA1_41_13b]|uniref:Response regulatory domain-containing protein n=1 Tax=Candidatus Woesebacteria bacterium GW2011_GWA1_41_13b TaxID=1618555 RepID=A0A0G0UT76_9BACT|nr:MAG: hypothetical protein UU42_C0006G0003 [Candidatus Woesebacteria bacterium GW2011_GWA1_41_13b]